MILFLKIGIFQRELNHSGDKAIHYIRGGVGEKFLTQLKRECPKARKYTCYTTYYPELQHTWHIVSQVSLTFQKKKKKKKKVIPFLVGQKLFNTLL